MPASNNLKKPDRSYRIRRYLPLALWTILLIIVYIIRLEAAQVWGPHFKEGDKIRITSMVSDEPQTSFDYAQNKPGQRIKMGQFSFLTTLLPEYHYGDRLQVVGNVQKSNYGWNILDPKVLVPTEEVFTPSDKRGDVVRYSLVKPLSSFRQKLTKIYQSVLPSRPAALLIGILLGTKNSLDSDFYNELKRTGTLHVVVASGTNVALFSGALLATLATYLGRKKGIAVTIILIWLYVVMSGLQPPIIRAGLMATLALSAQMFGREIGVIRVMGVIGVGMLLFNPNWLFDVGFQLSFAATFGIMFLPKYIEQFLKKSLPRIFTRGLLPEIVYKDFSTTLGAQIAVSPILIANFSPSFLTFFVSPIVNVLILWTVPIIMALGVVVGLVGLVWPQLAQLVAYFIWLPLEYMSQVISLFAKHL